MPTLSQTPITRPSPLNEYERELIVIAISFAQDIDAVTANDIWTIRNEASVTWVHLRNGKQLPFDRKQFSDVLQSAKKEYAARRTAGHYDNGGKVARNLKQGDIVKHDGQQWEVKSIYMIHNLNVHQTNHCYVRFYLVLVSREQTTVLCPMSEAVFEVVAQPQLQSKSCNNFSALINNSINYPEVAIIFKHVTSGPNQKRSSAINKQLPR